MVEKKEVVICIPAYLKNGSKVVSGFLCKGGRGKKLVFKAANEKQLKDLKNKDLKKVLSKYV